MKRTFACMALLLLWILAGGCGEERAVAPEQTQIADDSGIDTQLAAAEILAQAGWEIADGQTPPAGAPEKIVGIVTGFERREVAPGIAHYFWRVRVGPDPRDAIGLHRVVRERRPGVPVRAPRAMFLQHGDAKDFTGMFLPGTLSATTPDDFGAAAFWARNDVDVWGIDQAWNLVPAETSDFAFMAGWGVDRQSRDLGLGIAIARAARVLTGCGLDRVVLLGYSSGSVTGYAYLNAESQLPPGLRQVAGWIPVDYSPISDDAEWNAIQNCGYIDFYQQMLDNGEYGYFVGFDFLGNLARDDPDGDSPVFPGFTNLQAALYLGAGPIFNYASVHYLAGIWENDLPVGFQFVTVDQWLDFMIAGAPWEPVRFMLDYSVWGCRETDVPWDDHFAEITVPVLNVAAAGGIGPTTYWCLDQIGSEDITRLDIRLRPETEALYDYGHIDLWIAYNARDLVWEPILDWVVAHTGPGHRVATQLGVD
jgi:hypothetical protein